MKIQAAVLRDTGGRVSVEEGGLASPKAGEVLLRVAPSGLCHTDWETMHGYEPVSLPAVIDHESAGVLPLAEIDQGFDALEQGNVARAVIVFDREHSTRHTSDGELP